MKHPDNVDKKIKKNYNEKKQSISFEYSYEVKRKEQKDYSRFKSMNTDYSSSRKCQYEEKDKSCDPGCRFWMSCIHGRKENRREGDETNEQRT